MCHHYTCFIGFKILNVICDHHSTHIEKAYRTCIAIVKAIHLHKLCDSDRDNCKLQMCVYENCVFSISAHIL